MRGIVDGARGSVARLIGARTHEIVFTSSGTEACNLALWGSARGFKSKGMRIAATTIEHNAVLAPLYALADEGWTIDWIPVGPSGRVAVNDVAASLHSDTVLVACMAANNETGVVQPVAEIGGLCRDRGIRFLVDAVAAVGKIPVDVRSMNVDLVAFSGHKIGGTAGAGALYVREGISLMPIVSGGGQEQGLRGGTEDAVSIAAFGAAAGETLTAAAGEATSLRTLRDHLDRAVLSRVPGARIAGEGSERLPGTSQFLVPCDDEEMLILALDRAGFAVSAGAACAAGVHMRSHVLKAMGILNEGLASVRVSLGPDNTGKDVDAFVRALSSLVMAEARRA
jgi:cysteine desulfurase